MKKKIKRPYCCKSNFSALFSKKLNDSWTSFSKNSKKNLKFFSLKKKNFFWKKKKKKKIKCFHNFLSFPKFSIFWLIMMLKLLYLSHWTNFLALFIKKLNFSNHEEHNSHSELSSQNGLSDRLQICITTWGTKCANCIKISDRSEIGVRRYECEKKRFFAYSVQCTT